VTELLPDEEVFQWTPDGQFVYVGQRGTSLKVSLIELATGQRALWKTFSLPDPAGGVIWRSAVLTPDAQAYAYTYERVLDDLYLVDGLK